MHDGSYKLFNAYTDVLEALEAQNYGQAKALLTAAQQSAEEIYIVNALENQQKEIFNQR